MAAERKAMLSGFSDAIRKLGSSLTLDESVRTACPACFGGSKKEKSFTIKRIPSGIAYNCFRATCGVHGLIGDWHPAPNAEKKKKQKGPYMGSLISVSGALFSQFFLKYQLSVEDIEKQGIKFASEIGRLIYPIYDYRGYMIGENLRAVSPSQKPKVLINKFSDNVPLMHVPLGFEFKDKVVLVEDQTSAIKVSKLVPTIALLGTNLQDGGLSLLRQIGIKHITILLDADDAGISGSMKLQQRLGPFFNVTSIIIPHGKDPKDLDWTELNKILCD